MTKAAKAFGKELKHFWTRPDTVELLAELKKESAESAKYFESARGYQGGTWAHPKLAVFFARWLDTKFAVWCDAVIDDILKGHQKLEMVNKAESAVEVLPADVKAAGSAGSPIQACVPSLRMAAPRAWRRSGVESFNSNQRVASGCLSSASGKRTSTTSDCSFHKCLSISLEMLGVVFGVCVFACMLLSFVCLKANEVIMHTDYYLLFNSTIDNN